MKRNKVLIISLIISLIVSICIGVFFFVLYLLNEIAFIYPLSLYYEVQNEGLATPRKPVLSSDEEYLLSVSTGFDGNVIYETFCVKNNNTNEVEYTWDLYIRTFDNHQFGWVDKDTVYVYTSDTGKYYYISKINGEWVYDENN